MRPRRGWPLVGALALLLAASTFGVSRVGASRAQEATPRLPDLGMAQVRSFKIDTTTLPNRKLLRFTTEAVNVGAGPIELYGQRPNTSTPLMSVRQRIYNDSGGYIEVPTPATMHWSGDDGHTHWHTTDFIHTDLNRPDNGVKVGSSAKQDFCLLDSHAYRLTLPGAPQTAVYRGAGCGGASGQSSLTVTMGISVGWGDVYSSNLTRQWIDITGLANGRYRLTTSADPTGWYQESNEANNSTWTDIRISNNSVKLLARGPSA
jgi:hypothetical protein